MSIKIFHLFLFFRLHERLPKDKFLIPRNLISIKNVWQITKFNGLTRVHMTFSIKQFSNILSTWMWKLNFENFFEIHYDYLN